MATFRRKRRRVNRTKFTNWFSLIVVVMIVGILYNSNPSKQKPDSISKNNFLRTLNNTNKKNVNNVNMYSVKQGKSLAYWIWKGESPRRGANDYNRGSKYCRYSNRKNIRLTNMTIGKLKYYQSLPACTPNVIFAAGWQQSIPLTLKVCQRTMGFKDTDKYNQYLQDKIFVECLAKSKRPEIYSYVVTGKGLKIAARGVAREWASVGSPIHCKIKRFKKGKFVGYRPWNPGGGCYNSGYGINHHSISPAKILKSLQLARHNYVVLRKKGVNKMKAYAYAIGVKNY